LAPADRCRLIECARERATEPIDRRRVLIATVTPLASIFGGLPDDRARARVTLGALSVFGHSCAPPTGRHASSATARWPR